MGVNLENFNLIFYNKYRPWLMDYSDARYQHEWMLMNQEKEIQAPFFEVVFPKPLNDKRIFYKRLIENEAICFLNHLHVEIMNGCSFVENQLTIHCALRNNLFDKLDTIASIIVYKKYLPNQYERKEVYFSCKPKDADDSYIMYFLKHQLVRLYLEVQHRYGKFMRVEKLSEEDVYMKFFDHNSPGCIQVFEKTITRNNTTHKRDQDFFVPLKHDLRETVEPDLAYDVIVKNAEKFAQAESEFFNSGFISADYHFIEKRGRKREFAIITCCLIEKGYFNKYKHPGKRPITDFEIRRFLENRYSLDFDKIFRMARNESQAIEELTSKYRWLDIIYSQK